LNNGAWTYVAPRILTAANETQHHKGKYPLYAGREPTSSVATGSKVRGLFLMSVEPQLTLPPQVVHKKQIEDFLKEAFE